MSCPAFCLLIEEAFIASSNRTIQPLVQIDRSSIGDCFTSLRDARKKTIDSTTIDRPHWRSRGWVLAHAKKDHIAKRFLSYSFLSNKPMFQRWVLRLLRQPQSACPTHQPTASGPPIGDYIEPEVMTCPNY